MGHGESTGKIKFINGNEACAEAAIAAGVRFFAGYPITPSTEIAETLSKRLPQVGGKFIQMEDEIASMGAILGASLTGVKSLTATSGPGFSLKQELIGYAALCEIPSVIVNVQRGGPSTGLPTSPAQSDVMQARWGTHGDHPIIVLAPSSVHEMYELTVTAINLSESLRTPVILLSDEVVAHMLEKIEIPPEGSLKLLQRPKAQKTPGSKYLPFATRSPREVPAIANFGEGFRFNVTGLIHDLDGFPTNVPEKTEALLFRLHEKINSRIKEICFFDSENLEAPIILCSYGATARSCAQAAEDAAKEGIPVGVLKLKTLWPFPDFLFDTFAAPKPRPSGRRQEAPLSINPEHTPALRPESRRIDKLPGKRKTFIVCEMNMGQIVGEVRRVANGRFDVLGVHCANGAMITPQTIVNKIREIKHA